MITILRLDRLYLEFIYEVYREKVLLGADQLAGADVMVFFKNKGMQSELVENWNESSKKHLRSNYLNFMLDANLLSGDKNKRFITPPIMDDRLINYLDRMGETSIKKSILGVN